MRGGLVSIPSSRDFSLQGLSQAMHSLGTGSRREEPSLSRICAGKAHLLHPLIAAGF